MIKRFQVIVFILGIIQPEQIHATVVEAHSSYTYNEFLDDLVLLNHFHPDKFFYQSIGKSHYGKEIMAIRIGKGEKSILLTGAHHGREWMTSMLLMKMAEEYVSKNKPILDQVSIWLIPMVNPDGVNIQQGNFNGVNWKNRWHLWKMNQFSPTFSRWKANGKGVDLNRQYPAGWNELITDIDKPFFQFYKGKSPLSEPESKAVADFIKSNRPLIAAAYHSTGQVIYWHYHTRGSQMERDRRLAEKVSVMTGYKLAIPRPEATGAGLTDWLIDEWSIPAMTIEIGKLRNDQEVPLHEFNDEWKANKEVGWLLLQEAIKMKCFE